MSEVPLESTCWGTSCRAACSESRARGSAFRVGVEVAWCGNYGKQLLDGE